MAIRSHPGIHQLWDIVCEAVGKLRVFAVGGVNYVSSADGVLFTSVFHKFSGLNRHRDWYPFEPGHLQGLAYVWPPPSAMSSAWIQSQEI